METPLLAAALIVKNEERYLPGCIESLRGLGSLMSEICVYDTGSTDSTVDIARQAGCRVEEGYWDGDFARAKNAAGAIADAKWVLSIDADERLVVPDVTRFQQVLRHGLTKDFVGVDIMIIAIADIRQGVEVQTHNGGRLYRPSRGHWAGRVHERVVSRRSGNLVSHEPGKHIVLINHLGYGNAEAMPGKLTRNLALADDLIRDLEAASPRDENAYVQALVDRGRTRQALGNHAGAVDDLRRAWSIPVKRTYRAFGGELLAAALIVQGDWSSAATIISTLRREGVSHPSYCDWLEATFWSAQREHGRALKLLRRVDVLYSALGLVAKPRVVLEDRMWAAIAEGEHLEAASDLINLMAAQGIIKRKYGDLLVMLTRELPEDGLAELILEHDRGYLQAIAAELNLSLDPGPALAAELLRRAEFAVTPERNSATAS